MVIKLFDKGMNYFLISYLCKLKNTNYLSMKKIFKTMMLFTAALTAVSCGEKEQKQTEFDYNVESFADIQILRYKVDGFDELSLKQKTFVY
jgi:hypothetical protein